MSVSRRRHTRSFLISGLLVVALLAAGCGGGGSSDGKFTVGWLGDLTGPFGGYGVPILAGAETYFDTVNEGGGVHGKQIELQVSDTTSVPPTAIAGFNELARNPDVLTVGGIQCSACATVIAPLSTTEGLTQINGSNVDEIVDPDAFPYVFKVLPKAAQAAAINVKTALKLAEDLDLPAAPRVAFAGYDAPSTRFATEKMVAGLEDAGWTTTDPVFFPAGDTDLSSTADALERSDADIILTIVLSNHGATLFPALRNRGFSGPILQGGNAELGDAALTALDDEALYDTRALVHATEDEPITETVVSQAEATGHDGDVEHTAFTQGYVMAQVIVAALEACGSECDRKAFLDAMNGLSSLDTGGLTGPEAGFSADDHVLTSAQRVLVLDGEAVTVAYDWIAAED